MASSIKPACRMLEVIETLCELNIVVNAYSSKFKYFINGQSQDLQHTSIQYTM